METTHAYMIEIFFHRFISPVPIDLQTAVLLIVYTRCFCAQKKYKRAHLRTESHEFVFIHNNNNNMVVENNKLSFLSPSPSVPICFRFYFFFFTSKDINEHRLRYVLAFRNNIITVHCTIYGVYRVDFLDFFL